MKNNLFVNLVLVLAVTAFFFAGSVSKASTDESKTLEFNTIIGVPRPFTGGANAIRGVPGGGMP